MSRVGVVKKFSRAHSARENCRANFKNTPPALDISSPKSTHFSACFETISKKFPQFAIGETHRPVFIFGLPRSGTTLLYHLLSLYPNVFCPTTSKTIFHGMSLDDVREASSLVDLRRRMKLASKRHAFGFEVFANSVVSIRTAFI